MGADQRRQLQRIQDFFLIGHAQGHAVGQGKMNLHQGEVEGQGGDGKGHAAPGHIVVTFLILFDDVDKVAKIPVLDHHALGPARGAGGINAIRQRVGGKVDVRVGRVPFLQQLGNGQGFKGFAVQQRPAFPDDLFRGQHKAAAGIGHAVINAIVGIVRQHRQERAARLHDAVFRRDCVHGTGQQHSHRFIQPHAPGNQGIGNAVGPGVQFAVGQLFARRDDRHAVRVGQGLGFQHPGNGGEGDGNVGIVQGFDAFLRFGVQDADVLQAFLPQEFRCRHFHAGHEPAHEGFGVPVGVVFALEGHPAIPDEHRHVQRSLGFLDFQLPRLRRFPGQGFHHEIVALIGEHDVGVDMERLGYFREGIEVGRHAVHELVAQAADEILHPVVSIRAADHRQGLDQHGHRPLHTGIFPAVVDGGVERFLQEIVPHEHKGEHSVIEGVFRYAVVPAPRPDGPMVEPGGQGEIAGRRLGPRNVPLGQHIPLRVGQQRFIIRPGLLQPRRFPLRRFVQRNVKAGIVFGFHSLPGIGGFNVPVQDHEAGAVKGDVMAVQEQIITHVRHVDCRAAEPVVQQIKGPDQRVGQRLYADDLGSDGLSVVPADAVIARVVQADPGGQVRMGGNGLVHRRLQTGGVDAFGKLDEDGNVVEGGVRAFQGFR